MARQKGFSSNATRYADGSAWRLMLAEMLIQAVDDYGQGGRYDVDNTPHHERTEWNKRRIRQSHEAAAWIFGPDSEQVDVRMLPDRPTERYQHHAAFACDDVCLMLARISIHTVRRAARRWREYVRREVAAGRPPPQMNKEQTIEALL